MTTMSNKLFDKNEKTEQPIKILEKNTICFLFILIGCNKLIKMEMLT